MSITGDVGDCLSRFASDDPRHDRPLWVIAYGCPVRWMPRGRVREQQAQGVRREAPVVIWCAMDWVDKARGVNYECARADHAE